MRLRGKRCKVLVACPPLFPLSKIPFAVFFISPRVFLLLFSVVPGHFSVIPAETLLVKAWSGNLVSFEEDGSSPPTAGLREKEKWIPATNGRDER